MKAFILLPTCLFFAFILGCSSPAPKNLTATPTQETNSALRPEFLISQALKTQNIQQKSSLYLHAASLYWHSNLFAQTNAALISVDTGALSHNQLQQYLILTLQLGLLEANIDRLQTTLPLISKQAFQQSSITEQIELTTLLSNAYKITENHIQSAIVLIENAGLFSEDAYFNNHELIWKSLRNVEAASLSKYQYLGNNQDVQGWLALAHSIKQNQINLEAQYAALTNWHIEWPNHPASITLPHELYILQQLPTTKPKRITLALPLSGPISGAGKAIRDGFMASYFNHSSLLSDDIKISFFDTNKQNIKELYEHSDKNNALIIGPLDKKSLNQLSTLESIGTTTLALNYLDNSEQIIENLFQFGLSPEAETNLIAKRLTQKGLLNVAVIAPETNWGFRVHDAFSQALNIENGTLIESAYYSDQASLSDTVASLLATDASKARARKLRSITKTSFEFNPRRRKDLDAILMIAKPKLAKQITPLFAYHYADSIPIFSTSQVHEPTNNNDLEGVDFIEMPWMLNTTIDIKNQLSQIIPESSEKYTRFYALGVDAFKLAPRLPLLKEVNDSKINGHTGVLSMNSFGQITREMEWATFKRGKVISIQD